MGTPSISSIFYGERPSPGIGNANTRAGLWGLHIAYPLQGLWTCCCPSICIIPAHMGLYSVDTGAITPNIRGLY